jgi:hypothetical protein
MLWAQIVGALVLFIVLSYLIQWLLPRGKSKAMARRRYLRWDVAPLIAFFGAVLLILSFAQAVEANDILQWGGGAVFGLIVSGGAWTLGMYRPNPVTSKRPGWLQIVRRYGTLVIGVSIGLYLAIRFFGAPVQVLVAGTLGACAIVFALALFAENKPMVEE